MLVHAPRPVARRALGGAVILLVCGLSVSGHGTNDYPITAWYGGSAQTLKHRPPAAHKCQESCLRSKWIRLACTSVNFCVHSSTVRQNGAGFGYGITSIAQYGSGEPLGAAGDPPIIDPDRKRRRFGAI